MNAFQVGGISLAALLVAFTWFASRRGRLSRAGAASWTLAWLTMGTAIAEPELTRILAQTLGINRGADLVFYFGIVAMLVGFFALMARLRRIEQDITLIARHIALDEARTDGAPPVPGSKIDAPQG